jgi:hydrogenase maturation protein HypF
VGTRTQNIKIRGLVQGIGFRPFVYRIAQSANLGGWIINTNTGVEIMVTGTASQLDEFRQNLQHKKPLLADIDDFEVVDVPKANFETFSIKTSDIFSEEVTKVSPDLAVCDDCMEDLKNQQHRVGYPFINCTYCGPRFSIIKSIPYDRENTTMQIFRMCEKCAVEYQDIDNRRFHAQPIACNECGPEYSLVSDSSSRDFNEILNKVANLINDGGVVAVKGLGGYFLSCDAKNELAVKKLRAGKKRYGKPFAVMFRDIKAIKEYVSINFEEEKCLQDQRKPIVLLKSRKNLAASVQMGMSTVGAMLPYMPFHYLLFEKLNTEALVMTSGNLSEEPIAISNDEAIDKLTPLSDAILTYNRDVHNRVDDSVLFVVNNRKRFIRRSRGYVPTPIQLGIYAEGIFAAGAELVNCFAVGKGNDAILSQHIGDLKNAETLDFYKESVSRFERLFNFRPEYLVCDKHPNYLSSVFVREMGLPYMEVQHHYAHIVSCMAEQGLDEEVIGVSFDGTGFGDDGYIWGGEFFLADLTAYQRCYHLPYVPIPGGDKAVKQPWRTGLSYLYQALGEDVLNLDLPLITDRNDDEIKFVIQAIDKGINCPLSSSMGRLFDAMASIAGLCTTSLFHAQAPMLLESVIDPAFGKSYSYVFEKGVISLKPMFLELIRDLQNQVAIAIVSAKFHNTIISLTEEVVLDISRSSGIKKVILSGGSFQNRILLQELESKLARAKLEVYSNTAVPANDAGIALGQLYVAAKNR